MGHDPGPSSACTKGQQVHTEATSYAATWIQGTTTALPIGTTTTAEGKTDVTIGTIRTECAGPQASGSAGPPTPPPQAAPKPAAKPMPRRETPATDYVPPMTPSNVITYCRVLTDYTGTQVRSFLNTHVSATDTELALSHVQGPMANVAQSTWRQTSGG